MSLEDGVDKDGYFYETTRMIADSFQEWLNRDPHSEAAALQVRREIEEREAREQKAKEPIDPRLQAFRDSFAEIAHSQS